MEPPTIATLRVRGEGRTHVPAATRSTSAELSRSAGVSTPL